MKCSWEFKKPNVYSRGTSCGEVAKFRVRGAPLCRKHAAGRVFDNVINVEGGMDKVGLEQL